MQLPSILSPDLGLFVWMLLAFLVIIVVVGKYGFPVIIKMVEDRQKFINESLQHAREANEKLETIKAQGDAILREAREQQATILKEAMATSDGIIGEARSKAQVEGQKLFNEAKAQITAEKEAALRDIKGTVSDLSVKVAERVVMRQLSSEEADEAYIGQLLNEVNMQK